MTYLCTEPSCGHTQEVHGVSGCMWPNCGCRLKMVIVSARDLELMRYLSQGYTLAEIAEIDGMNPKAIQHYLSNLYKKLRIRNATQLVVLAFQRGLLLLNDIPKISNTVCIGQLK